MKRLAAAAIVSAFLCSPPVRADSPVADTIVTGVTGVVGILEKHKLPIDADKAQRAVVDAIVRIADPAAHIMTRAAYDHMIEERAGSDYGAGIRISMTNGQPRIIDVAAGSPAAEAGLQAGDIITVAGDAAIESSTIAACHVLLRGSTARTVRIQYTRDLASTNFADVELKLMKLPAIETAEELPDNLAYIKINGLFPGSGKEIVSVLRGWAETGRFGVVVDLRGAIGSDLASVTEIASLVAASEAQLYAFQDPAGQDLDVARATVGSPANMPMMLLTDPRTAGSPEVLAAVIADSVRGAMVIGGETAGDPMIREPVEVPSGEILYIATRRLATAEGKTYAGGIKPDIAVVQAEKAGREFEPDFSTSDRRVVLEKEYADRALRDRLRGDDALKRAVDILLGLKALNIRGITITKEDPAN